MTEARAISAQLVDIRNVGAHKCVKLTIHVPEEQALRVTQLFGWPTGAAPVSVALARLEDEASPRPSSVPVKALAAGAERKKFDELPPPQQAGILSNSVAFQRFLRESYTEQWVLATETHSAYERANAPENVAARTIRRLCHVKSRANIEPDNTEWLSLMLAYKLWQKEAEVVPA